MVVRSRRWTFGVLSRGRCWLSGGRIALMALEEFGWTHMRMRLSSWLGRRKVGHGMSSSFYGECSARIQEADVTVATLLIYCDLDDAS